MATCKIDDCGRPKSSKGYCQTHYARLPGNRLDHIPMNAPIKVRSEAGLGTCVDCGTKLAPIGTRTRKNYGRRCTACHLQRQVDYRAARHCSIIEEDGTACTGTYSARGLCHKHLDRLYNHGSTDEPLRAPARYDLSTPEGRNEEMRDWRDRVRSQPVPEHVHGTVNGYTNYSCRCGQCLEANRERERARKARAS